jgi:peptidylprolyl isomerase
MQAIPGFATTFSIIRPGAGAAVKKGNTVTVHANGGVLNADGSRFKFWSTKDPGQKPFTYQSGVGKVIVGWDQGVLGMQLGEVRQIVIPGKEGYGPSGFPAWKIPSNATLDFEIEVLEIK